MNVYFVRHGESDANLLKVFSNRNLNHPLTPRGREQVAALADKLAGIRFGSLYCSPVPRAHESARILGQRMGLQPTQSEALREFDVGIYEGRSDPEGWSRYEEVRDLWFRQRQWDARMEGGESFNDIRARFMPLIEQLRAGDDGSPPALLVGHGGTFCCMLPLVFSNVELEFALSHGLSHTDFVLGRLGRGEAVCLQWGSNIMSP